jgi:hypothetical protein
LDTYTVNGDPVTDYVAVYTHIFPLPYHNHAFFLARLAPYIYERSQCGGAVNEYKSWALKNQDKWLSGQASNMTEPEILDSICTNFAAEFGQYGYTKSECLEAIHDRKYELLARTSWKFATYNGVNATPTVLLNGIPLGDDTPFTQEDWVALLKNYLPSH